MEILVPQRFFLTEVLRRSIPENIFRDYQDYRLRQLYVARKM
jgi:hypothetical protein